MVTLPNTIEMALVIAKLEGPAVSQYCTLRILPGHLMSPSMILLESCLNKASLSSVTVADGGSLPVGRHPVSPPSWPIPSQASSFPLPPCFISSVYRRVAAGPSDSNRRWWESSASLERWRGRGEPDLSWRRRIAGRSRV
ncbi:hypothetical protein F2Q68_00045193 [Brassica cretica]|uniref:Uncharacterized protein n=1 Tax=Brassica cretica TaxID=69181 RepID=A0A8S9LQ52_BRACR|nr:hypothetical protein F2Q68_00045193 [Brassica cretica]